MGADSRGGSKQEKSGVAPNKEKHVTEQKPKQTNQTDNSVQEKHERWYHREPRKQRTCDTEMKMEKESKWFPLTCKGSTPPDQSPLEMKCCQQTETQTENINRYWKLSFYCH